MSTTSRELFSESYGFTENQVIFANDSERFKVELNLNW
jgi:hypothetical protein